MKGKKRWLVGGILLLSLTLFWVNRSGWAAPAAPAPSTIPVPLAVVHPLESSARGKDDRVAYRWAQGLQVPGYETLTLAEFNAKVANWQAEESFHLAEDRFQQIRWNLEDTDPLKEFVNVTLKASLEEASCKHYGGSCTRMSPCFYDSAVLDINDQIFHDPVTVFSARVDYSVDYQIFDAQTLTVGERDKVILAFREGLETLLQSKTEAQLTEKAAMEPLLKAEIVRLQTALSTRQMKLTKARFEEYFVEGRTPW